LRIYEKKNNFLKVLQNLVHSRSIVPIIISISLTIRFTYAFFFIDPLSGSEYNTYVLAAADMLSNGFFGKAHAIPVFPVGYPWFIAVIQTITGPSLVYISSIQIAIFGFASVCFFKFVSRFLSREISVISLVLLSFSPALIAASTIIMYEVPMLSFLIIGLYLLFKTDEPNFYRQKVYIASLSGLSFGVAALMQPKIIVAEISIIAIRVLHEKKYDYKRIVIVLAILIPIALAPALNIGRNFIAGDGVGYTKNYSINVVYGAINSGGQIKTNCVNPSKLGYDNFEYSLCLQKEKFIDRPGQAMRITFDAAFNLLTPYLGSLQLDGGGTWFHAFDFRRVLPFYNWSDKDSSWNFLDRIVSLIWMAFWISLTIRGAIILFRSGNKYQLSVLLFPVLSLLLVSVFAAGDSRYRLPVAPLYYILIAVSIQKFLFRDTIKHRPSKTK
jgi:4-amino-4-deoxy-L-arabinose transferase-like glycosyltransferase